MFIKMFIIFFIILSIFNFNFVSSGVHYEPNWQSLDHRPHPSWYDEAKIGIFIHWGLYSVPGFGTEWFWFRWKGLERIRNGWREKDYMDFMTKNYKPNFTYQDFAKDFTAELFNSTKWALLFQDSGAKYVVLTSKHHDGYTLWPSTRSFSWNAMDVGPKRDIISEFSTAIRNTTSLKFGLYYSLFEWYNRMYMNDIAHSFKTNIYVQYRVLPELHELIEVFKPEILWSDGDWEASASYWNATEFIAWLYNNSTVRETIVVNDRWGMDARCAHGDFYVCADHYNPGVLREHKWENAFPLDTTSWGHKFDTDFSQYMTSKKLIKELVTTISCNGNILINVGPTSLGTIPPIFEERLRDMGKWLKHNGEAIYSSKPWVNQNDTQTAGVWYTQKPTDDKHRINVYAIILDYPYDTNYIDLYSLGGKIDGRTKVEFLGLKNMKIEWSNSKTSLHVKLPPKNLIDKHELDFAWTLKINIQA